MKAILKPVAALTYILFTYIPNDGNTYFFIGKIQKMAASERIQELKLLIGDFQELRSKEYWAAPDLPGGIPRGVIVELLGPWRTEWFLQFLKMHPEFKTFWAEKNQQVLPTAIVQRGVNLESIFFATLGQDIVTPLRKVIQSQLYEVVLAPTQFTEIKIFKALQLFTEKSNCTLFLLGDKTPSTAWPISLQLEIHKKDDTHFDIQILKQRHGRMDG